VKTRNEQAAALSAMVRLHELTMRLMAARELASLLDEALVASTIQSASNRAVEMDAPRGSTASIT
jgi:hypothetical protein